MSRSIKRSGTRNGMLRIRRASRSVFEPLDARVLMTGTAFVSTLHDVNGNGIKDPEEPPLVGWTVFVDYDRNGALDAGEPSQLTNIDGEAFITGVLAGTWDVREVLEPGWAPSPGYRDFDRVQIRDNQVTEILFLNVPSANGSIEGDVWNDINGDGVRDPGDPGLSGWTVFIDEDNSGNPDPGEPVSITDPTGFYFFPDLAVGTYKVREVVQPNWDTTVGYDSGYNVDVGPGAPTIQNFGNFNTGTLGSITGTVWNDINADGVRSAADNGLSGWTVFVDTNLNSTPDIGELSSVTDGLGNFSFPSIVAGTYRVMEVLQAGWNTSPGYPAAQNITVVGDNTSVVQFGVFTPTLGSISGKVWNDVNGDGILGAEPGLEGWTVFIDQDSNGILDAGEPNTLSNASGDYALSNVAIGSNLVREIPGVGWTPTAPATAQQLINVPNATNVAGINFGNKQRTDGAIRGKVFFDADHDGSPDAGERGLSGITVYLDNNNNGSLNVGEPSTVSSIDLFYTPAVNEAGAYEFVHLGAGPFHVREILPVELSATPADERVHHITLLPGEERNNVHFANRYRANEIHGTKYEDLNGNHQRDAGEPGIPGVTIYLDQDRDNIMDASEQRTLTAADGSYSFATNLVPGSYVVREISPWGYLQTYPTTTGGILWPTGVSNPAVGNVSPLSITHSLATGETFTQNVTLTLPGTGGLTNMADVFLLFDDTGSFTANSPIVRAAFPLIIAALQSSLPGVDLGFGVGRLEEYANFASEYATGRPFVLNQPILSQAVPGFMTAIQAALDRTTPGYGGDQPETDIEALFQAVTGVGFDGNNNGTTTDSGPAGSTTTQLTPGSSGDVPAFSSFTPTGGVLPPSGNVGGAGFRPGALPIILLATDTGVAYQPKGETSIIGLNGVTLPISALTQLSRNTTPFGSGAGIQETVTALNALGALVIGLGTNTQFNLDPRQMLESLAKLTGSINQSTSTIANGTLDPVAPGDPFYFQISSGFGTSVANGIVTAIQNAVTNVSYNITLKASDPRVHITSNPGVVNNIGAGQTAAFDVTFTGDGMPHRFDLQFVRQGTDVVLGSIPVVLGTPIPGDGYEYGELEDGEIDDTVDFGNMRDPAALPNVAPSFTAGPNVSVLQDVPDQVIPGWATSILAGPPSEASQTVNFIVSNDNNGLFAIQPAIDTDGTLAFRPAAGMTGTAVVTVQLHDNGGTYNGGVDTSAPQTFTIIVNPSAVVTASSSFEYQTRHALVINFNQDVGSEFTLSDVQVINANTSAPVALQMFDYNAATHQATVRFNPLVLADGNYRMTIPAGSVPNMTSTHQLDFFALAADANRDRSVNLDDFTALAANFGLTGRVFGDGDFNFDGSVNLDDFTTLAAQFGTTLAPPPAARPAGASASPVSSIPPLTVSSPFSGVRIDQDHTIDLIAADLPA